MGKIENLLVNKGLYDSIEITIDDFEEIEQYLSNAGFDGNTIDCYCMGCKTNRIFEYSANENFQRIHNRKQLYEEVAHSGFEIQYLFNQYKNQRYALCYSCTRDNKHIIQFDLNFIGDKIIKIGQFPSVADLAIPEITKYKVVLGDYYKEFSKAIGLFAHGIGIGSFVYLRRILENLVFDIFNQNKDELNVAEADFLCLKFDQKIDKLKDYLSVTFVKNKNVYGIVSKGIHELSEEECIEMFPCIKVGIEMILDDLLTEKGRKEKEKIFEKFVAQKTGDLKSR